MLGYYKDEAATKQVIDSKDISTQVTLAIWIKKSLFILLEERRM